MAAPRKLRKLPPLRHYYRRLFKSFLITLIIVGVSLGLGVSGYVIFGGLSWLDAFLNASMILTGMGPVNPMVTPGGKVFASFYALYSGIAFLGMMAILLEPVVHRFMHRFHLEMEDEENAG